MGFVFSLIRTVFRNNDLVAGIFFVLFSYLAFLFPLSSINKITSLLFGASYYLGFILIANYITVKIGGFSLIARIYRSQKEKANFTRVCIVAGILFSLITADLGGLWYFPYWTITDYIVIGFLLGGWVFYLLFVMVSYEAGKVIFDKLLLEEKFITNYYRYEKYFYAALLVLGLISAEIVVIAAIYNTHFFTHFVYTISQPKKAYLQWYYWMIGVVGAVYM